jgi:coproporphyrinogen III oxidase-like Fe-S oxidoreductase
MVEALRNELQRCPRASITAAADSIFFGGGTPSPMPGLVVADIIKEVSHAFGFRKISKSRSKPT